MLNAMTDGLGLGDAYAGPDKPTMKHNHEQQPNIYLTPVDELDPRRWHNSALGHSTSTSELHRQSEKEG